MKVLVVAPYHGLGEMIKQMTGQYRQFDMTVVVADMKESLSLIDSFKLDGYDIVISRGGTARLLAQHTDIPVVEIQVSGFDVLRMLTLMKEYQAKIRLIGFPNIIQSFVSVSNLLDYNFLSTVISDEHEVESALIAAKEEGIQVIVGDTVTVRFANDLGMQGVLITSGRESVAEAFRTAELICRSLEEHKEMNRIYEQALLEGDREMAIMDRSLDVLFATPAIQSIWGGAHGNVSSSAGMVRDGFLGDLVEGMANEIEENGPLFVFEPVQKMTFTLRVLKSGSKSDRFLLTMSPPHDEGEGIRLIYPNRDLESFPSFIHFNETMETALRTAKNKLSKGEPVTVYGEPGTGKRIFVGALSALLEKDSTQMEIEVRSGDEASFRRLGYIIGKSKPESLLHIRGIQRFSGAHQKRLVEKMKGSALNFIFSFDDNPDQLKGEYRLDPKLLEWIHRDLIKFHPLRERLDELEELVRTFVTVFNEKYGKQIVGIRPDTWQVFRKKAWKGNLIELRDTVDLCVQHAQGEYIERSEVESLASRSQAKESAGADKLPYIDLNQTLEDIERKIIRIVLEEEDMNQSKAAKRLNINRTTLWRKVKEDI